MPKVDLKSNFININLIMKWLALNRSFQECLFICIVEVLGWDQMNYLGKIINHSCCIWHLSVILSSLSNLIDRFSDSMLLLKVFQSSALFLKSVVSNQRSGTWHLNTKLFENEDYLPYHAFRFYMYMKVHKRFKKIIEKPAS